MSSGHILKTLLTHMIIFAICVTACGEKDEDSSKKISGDGAGNDAAVCTGKVGGWTQPCTLIESISPDGTSANSPQVALDDVGNAIIIWKQSGEYKTQVFMSEFRSGAWKHPSDITDHVSNVTSGVGHVIDPRVAMSNSGSAVVVWYHSTHGGDFIERFFYQDGQWQEPFRILQSDFQGGARVAMNDMNEGTIVWWRNGVDWEEIFKMELHDGVWDKIPQYNEFISPEGSDAASPETAMDNLGNKLIVWQQDDKIFKSEYRNDIWTHPADLNDYLSLPEGSAFNPKVAMGSNGDAMIAWHHADSEGDKVYVKEYRDSQWQPNRLLNGAIATETASDLDLEVAMDDNGNTVVVWNQSDGNNQRVYRAEYRESEWIEPQAAKDFISSSGAEDATTPHVAISNDGGTTIVWKESIGDVGRALFSDYHQDSWSKPMELTQFISYKDNKVSTPRVALDNLGNGIIVWSQKVVYQGETQIFMSERR